MTYAAGGAGNTPYSGARTVTAGATNRGGGGGGSEGLFGFPGAPNPVVGANGGSGIVIIAYPTS